MKTTTGFYQLKRLWRNKLDFIVCFDWK